MSELIANYSATGIWDLEEIGVDLETVHDWWVQSDILYIEREENGDIEEYWGGAEEDYEYLKRPVYLLLKQDSHIKLIENKYHRGIDHGKERRSS